MATSASSSSSSMLFPISFSSHPFPNGNGGVGGGGGGGSVGCGVSVMVGDGAGAGGGVGGYIEHPVSKLDTLAGVAIKYGVEVADIKRINGLVTDLQMFALKTLQIPLPGRHPPSQGLSNGSDSHGSEQTPLNRRHSDFFDSFVSLKLKSPPQPKASPAMSNLQGYYGLNPMDQKTASKGCEMTVYRKGGSNYIEDGAFAKPSPLSDPSLSHPRKSKSIANGFMLENGELADDLLVSEAGEGDSEKWAEKLVRRRQKFEADFSSHTPEMLLKEDNGSSGGGFSAITGKGLALRSKAASRTVSAAEADAGWQNTIPIGMGDWFVVESFSGVRKSSSTSTLQDSESMTSSIWPTPSKWSLKTDLQALSTSAIARPLLDGLPNPITGRRNKAALD